MTAKKLFGEKGPNRLVLASVMTVLVALPFATPISVFLGSQLHHLDLFKVWEEIILIIVAAIVVASRAYRTLPPIKDRSLRALSWLIIAYCLWTVLMGLVGLALHHITLEALVYALIVNLRFFLFFWLCWLAASNSGFLQTNWQRVVLVPAAVVVGFGLLQSFVLPANFLEHIGYGTHTVAAYQTVDQNSAYDRVQSTLRGPNPLGAYLIIVVTAALVGLWKKRWLLGSLMVGSLIVLFYSYSRSAWIGLAGAVAVLVYISIKSKKVQTGIAVAGLTVALVVGGTIYIARDDQFVQKTVFHTDETSLSPQSSNTERAQALERGLHDVLHEPLGRGPGSAGPASLYNSGHPIRIAENYYLQIGQELGWVGLGLYIAITVQIVRLLWQRRNQAIARVLLASLAGITFVNLLSHAWTDETLSLIWWGLAGIALVPSTLAKHDAESTTQHLS